MTGRIIDRLGQRFGLLVVTARYGYDLQGRVTWMCQCDCGTQKVVPSRHLGSGAIVSCGCYQRSIAAQNGKSGAGKHSGTKCHLYKPELSYAERLGERNLVELRVWRKSVISRDNGTCDICGSQENPAAHHLNSWTTHPDERFIVENGITLCKTDHNKFHRSLIGGTRTPCRVADYEQFKIDRRKAAAAGGAT